MDGVNVGDGDAEVEEVKVGDVDDGLVDGEEE